MDAPRAQISMARIVAVEVALVAVFPLSARFAASRAPTLVPTSVGAWWRADLSGVAVPVLWIAGFALAVWLLATMALYAWATRSGHERIRRIVGGCTAPLVRRVVDAAIVVSIGTAVLAAPALAFARPPVTTVTTGTPAVTSTSRPPVIRSGSATADTADGPVTSAVVRAAPIGSTSMTGPTRAPLQPPVPPAQTVPPVIRSGTPTATSSGATAPSVRTQPDLRAPAPTTALPVTAAPSRTTTSQALPVTTAPSEPARLRTARSKAPRPVRTVVVPPAPPVTAMVPAAAIAVPADHHVIGAGESLWSIAGQQLLSVRPDARAADVAHYWAAIVATNRPALRSGDPSLVFPGEVIELPPTG